MKNDVLPAVEPIAFLFDLDGVLIDSEKEYTKIWGRINDAFPTGVSNFEQKIKGTTLSNILNTYFPAEIHDEVVRRLIAEENAMRYHYCPGVKEFLHNARNHGILMAIVTSSDDKKMAHLRDELPHLCEEVDLVIDASMTTRSKPDPQGYLLAASKLGVPPERCVVFEDSLQGIRAGKSAGAFVVGLSGTLGREAIENEANLTIDSFSEINISKISALLQENANL